MNGPSYRTDWVKKLCKDCGKPFITVPGNAGRDRCCQCWDKHFFTLRKRDWPPLEFRFKG